MGKSLQISLVSKGQGTALNNQIEKIGGVLPDDPAEQWQVSQRTAIMGIEAGSWEFHIMKGDQPVKVVIAHSLNGDKYLAAETDAPFENSLLCLPEM